MLFNIILIGLLQSVSAIFHHHKFPHGKIHVCLTPPNTMFKVQKHIHECQHSVKSSVFNEAFSLINHHAYHHPHDHSAIDIGVHDEYDHRNFSLTEQEILKFFETHDSPHEGHIDAIVHNHPIDHHVLSHEPIVHHPHEHLLGHLHGHLHGPHDPHVQFHGHSHPWKNPYIETLHKKTDEVPLNNNPEVNTEQNPYTYFNVDTGEAVKTAVRKRRDVDTSRSHIDLHPDFHVHPELHPHADIHIDIHSDVHSDIHSDSHSDIHPTTASFKDKRIAGCLMHCLYEKEHAIDPHSGYPTLDGLVNFYSDGVHEHGFFMSTLRAVDSCLKGASHKYHINRHVKPNTSVSCDLAFDIFDCVSDKITEYCSKHHYHYHDGHYHDDHYHDDHYHKVKHLLHGHDDKYHDAKYHDDDYYYYT